MRKNILFSINTEYHVFIISSLIEQFYSDINTFKVTVLIAINKGGNRFNNNLAFEHLRADMVYLPIENAGITYDANIKETLDNILSQKYERFIFFLEQTPINQYLINRLSKKGAIISLAPEGTKPYITITKAALPSRILATAKNYKFFLKQKLKVDCFYFVQNKNGFLKHTDEVWINHPKKYLNQTNKKVITIDLFNTNSQIETASKIFNFDKQREILETDNILFYLNQWYVDFKVYDFEIQTLEYILSKYPKKQLYIKLHPTTHKFQIDRFEQMDRVVVIKSTIPAEIFIATLKNSIIFSFWSASLLLNNPTCKFYWLHKLLYKQKLMSWWSIENPTDHIYEIQDIDLLIF